MHCLLTPRNTLFFSRDQFKGLLELSVKESPFIFNNNIYIQTNGVAMDSSLGPSFAYALLCFHEDKWIKYSPDSFRPVLYET